MRLRLGIVGCLLLAGCISIDKEDRRPGGLVWMENKATSWLPADLATGEKARMRDWTFVRVIAPQGATECRAEKSFFDGPNPYPKGKPDANRAILLTVRNEQAKSVFVCLMSDGVEVRREAPSTKVTYMSRISATKEKEYSYWVVPPLVHIDPSDPDAEKHWAAVREEVCPASGSKGNWGLCKPGLLDEMKLADRAGPAG